MSKGEDAAKNPARKEQHGAKNERHSINCGTRDNGQFSSIRAAFRVVGRALERTFRVFEATRDHLQARSKRFG